MACSLGKNEDIAGDSSRYAMAASNFVLYLACLCLWMLHLLFLWDLFP